jgi:hypothetical protein
MRIQKKPAKASLPPIVRRTSSETGTQQLAWQAWSTHSMVTAQHRPNRSKRESTLEVIHWIKKSEIQHSGFRFDIRRLVSGRFLGDNGTTGKQKPVG